jgi:hypothetical protein
LGLKVPQQFGLEDIFKKMQDRDARYTNPSPKLPRNGRKSERSSSLVPTAGVDTSSKQKTGSITTQEQLTTTAIMAQPSSDQTAQLQMAQSYLLKLEVERRGIKMALESLESLKVPPPDVLMRRYTQLNLEIARLLVVFELLRRETSGSIRL